jgi:hypothetical protein
MDARKTIFEIRDYGYDGDVMLIRIQETNRGAGIPPTWSQIIMMPKDELEQLMKAINAYKGRS